MVMEIATGCKHLSSMEMRCMELQGAIADPTPLSPTALRKLEKLQFDIDGDGLIGSKNLIWTKHLVQILG